MYKASVVGLDNSGKSSVVRELKKKGFATIHLTNYRDAESQAARYLGSHCNRAAIFCEKRGWRFLTGLAYYSHLIPYHLEEIAKRRHLLLVSDREPRIDWKCYADFYFPQPLRPPLRFVIERAFDYPNSLFYLDISPETSIARKNKPPQLHDDVRVLSRIKDLFEEAIRLAEQAGVNVVRIDAERKPLEEVTNEVSFHLHELAVL